MPVYLYECDVCGKRFELQRHFRDPHPTDCPEGHPGLHRVFSPPTVIFKGSGFYVTDNARSNGRPSQTESKEKDKNPKSEKSEKEPKAKERDSAS
jgi:putative FmdB family regulatory protein